jgi:hypothetical protein
LQKGSGLRAASPVRCVNASRLPDVYNVSMKSPKNFWWKMRKKLGAPKLLCDTCKYDYHTVCLNPQRPNATECSEYRKR